MNAPLPKTAPLQSEPSTSGLAIGSLVCGILGFCTGITAPVGIILGILAIKAINKAPEIIGGKGLAIGGLVLSCIVTLVSVALIGIGILPALARAKAKANRIKCVNNLGSVGRSLHGFAADNSERMPWQLSRLQAQNHIGSSSFVEPSAGAVYSIVALKAELATPKVLLSPCDPARIAANEVIQSNWASFDSKSGIHLPSDSFSYGLCEGGSSLRPATVLAVTRNIHSDLNSNWTGADEYPTHPNAFAGLIKSQGQLVMADGSARQSTNADLGLSGKITSAHTNSRGGHSVGPASTLIWR